mgnify:FL=1
MFLFALRYIRYGLLGLGFASPIIFLTVGTFFVYTSPNYGAPMKIPSFETDTSCVDTTTGSTPSE